MRLKSLIVVLVACLSLGLACSDDDPTGPGDGTPPVTPQSPAGVMGHFGDSPLQFWMQWVDSSRSTADGYNAYKSIGNGVAVKQNSTLIIEQVFGPPGSAMALGYNDTTLDSTSTSIHRYWVTAVRDGQESPASDSVVFVPSQFDINNHLSGLSPNNVQGVALVPTFSWDAKAGANSYMIVVQEGLGSSPAVWSYRTTSTQCTYRENNGITYSDLGNTTLAANTEIGWGIAALNADNFGFATSFQEASASFTTGSGVSTPPVAPQSPAGIMAHFGDSPLQFVVHWVDSSRSTADGYNAYKSIGNGAAVKQNTALIVEEVSGPPGSATGLLCYDTALDSTSTNIHRYWVTAVRAGQESPASDSVVFVPSQFDINNHLSGLSPNNVQGVALVPTFSWNAQAGATSYVIGVLEGPGPSRSVWSYRTTSTQCTYRENSGITYSDLGNTTLAANTEIHWGIAALNADNFGFATSFQDASGSFTTTGTSK